MRERKYLYCFCLISLFSLIFRSTSPTLKSWGLPTCFVNTTFCTVVHPSRVTPDKTRFIPSDARERAKKSSHGILTPIINRQELIGLSGIRIPLLCFITYCLYLMDKDKKRTCKKANRKLKFIRIE